MDGRFDKIIYHGWIAILGKLIDILLFGSGVILCGVRKFGFNFKLNLYPARGTLFLLLWRQQRQLEEIKSNRFPKNLYDIKKILKIKNVRKQIMFRIFCLVFISVVVTI